MKGIGKVIRFILGMGDVGQFHHFMWVAVLTAFLVGAALKGMAPRQTLLPLTGAIAAGFVAGWLTYRIELRHRGTTER